VKATQLLEKQHRQFERLFDALEDARDDATRERNLFDELAKNLVAHDAIERTMFYPACARELGLTPILGESQAAHGIVEFGLYACMRALGHPDFMFKLAALRDVVSHHVDEEEDELFPEVTEAVEELGPQMNGRFEEVLREDYRARLQDNLE